MVFLVVCNGLHRFVMSDQWIANLILRVGYLFLTDANHEHAVLPLSNLRTCCVLSVGLRHLWWIDRESFSLSIIYGHVRVPCS